MNEVPYQVSPANFKLITYPKDRDIESFVGEIYKIMKEEEEKELRLKEARKKKKLKSKAEGEGSTSPERSESQSPINLKLTNMATSSVKNMTRLDFGIFRNFRWINLIG